MIFSSNDPTPMNDLSEDTDITDKFRYRQNVNMSIPYPAMTNFCNRPNLKSAKALLKAYDIPYPLASNIIKLKKNKTRRQNITNDVEQKGAALATNHGVLVFKELMLLDTLHDLQNSNPQLIYEIFKREIGKTNIPKSLFLASHYSFTQEVVKYIKTQHPISVITSEVHIKLRKQNDFELQKILDEIVNLHFVLDNIIAIVFAKIMTWPMEPLDY